MRRRRRGCSPAPTDDSSHSPVDTAELTIAGQDPVGYIERFHDRIAHVHLKDTRHTDELGEYRKPVAEHTLLEAGGERR